MSQTDPQFKLRIPAHILGSLKTQAMRNRRSMNAEIVLMIERALEFTQGDLSSCSGQTEKEGPCQR
ncbi:Arc-like DNA binding domain protein [compost metagenome]